MSGAILLGQLVGRLRLLEVACDRCGRAGRLSVSRLVAEHGATLPLPSLRLIVAADCPRLVASASIYDRCGVHFPGLVGLDLRQV